MSVDHQYGIGVDGQGRVIRKACLQTVMQSLTSFIKSVHIWRKDFLWCVYITTEVSGNCYDLVLKSQGMFRICLRPRNANSFFIF